MSRILVDSIRSNSASADAITLDGSGNLTIPGNATCSGTATGFGIGGKVLQVVYGTTSSSVFNYTSTLADTNLTATITPSATTSKILVIVSQAWSSRKTNAAYSGGFIGIFRGSTQITANTGTSMYDMYISAGGATSNERYDRLTLVQLDEPSTTSATAYKTRQAASETVSGGSFVACQSDNRTSYMTLMEIGA
tara:strand:- start:207 stop:788 length:582 start_codon:yes stop_codon:yes gene_type:complete